MVRTFFRYACAVACFAAVLWADAAAADETPTPIVLSGGSALVERLEGEAVEVASGRPLKAGDTLATGVQVRTGEGARMSLHLPDGSFIRFDGGTTFALTEAAYDGKAQTRRININVILGKAWAKVVKLLGRTGFFTISTPTATAGVRGTIYRVNVNADQSAVVKVYWGEILVEKKKALQSGRVPASAGGTPYPVAGPTAVAGPRPVSMESWIYILQAMQQVNIRPDGTANPPFRFDREADLNEWVRWNQALDRGAE